MIRSTPAIKPILKYPGAKWGKAAWITSFFPEHTHYLEPYCGSAAVFFNKTPSPHEILNDLSSAIVNLFRVLRDPEASAQLATWIEFTPWSEAEYRECRENYTNSDDPVENARRFLVRGWQGRNGAEHQPTGWRHSGITETRSPLVQWQQLPERLLATVHRLKDAEIRNRPALEMIAYYNDPGCLIYADPPYPLSTRSRKYYRHEMNDDEHVALLNALDVHRGPVVLSGYAHPLYDSRLSRWHRVSAPAVTEHGNIRQEVLWINPKAAQAKQLSWLDCEVAGD